MELFSLHLYQKLVILLLTAKIVTNHSKTAAIGKAYMKHLELNIFNGSLYNYFFL